MKKHINADFFKLLIAFLIICASFNPGLSDAASHQFTALTQAEKITDSTTQTMLFMPGHQLK